MNEHAASAANREEHALQTLLRAIAARDPRTTSRLLAQAPSLARMAVRVGASREQQTEIIRLLLNHGARPSDRNSAGRSVKDCVKAEWVLALLRQP